MNWYNFSKSQIEIELNTNSTSGLGEAEVKNRVLKHGLNELPEEATESWFSIFFRQFKSSLIYILLACSVIVYFTGEREDSLIILFILLFNAVLGAVQEGRSQNTLRSLKKLSNAEATVLRDGEEKIISEQEVVPGDIVILQEGQKVVADARVIHSSNLSCDEAALTGESGAVLKSEEFLSEKDIPVSGQKNMVFKGTSILAGNGLAVAVGTGLNTEIGKISKAVLGLGDTEIPLKTNIRRLSKVIVYTVGIISISLFVLGLLYGRSAKEMFAIVVSLSVSMIPEGLPLVLTLILVTGVQRMSKRNALVKKLQAVEALGQAKVIAVDKTGTITKNEMVIKKLFVAGKIYKLSGSGYDPKGHMEIGGKKFEAGEDEIMAARIASLASRATVYFVEKDGRFKVSGDPTEAAMVVFGEKLGYSRESLTSSYKEIAEMPFNYKTKFRAIFYEHQDKVFCAVSGAPEVLISKASKFQLEGKHLACTHVIKKQLEEEVEEFSKDGLRVVAFGYKIVGKTHTLDNIEDLVFGGLYAMEDAVRSEALLAVNTAQKAGVKMVMITGDHKSTGRAIAREVGIFKEGDMVLTGDDLNKMSIEELAKNLSKISVFARVTPEDKMKIIQAYKHAGLIVAMTGDGVNDAPSLVAADLGVAMGKIGTEVAKEASDIILLDDNLGSIVAAIEEGRNMYNNIRKILLFLFSTSMGELFTITFALFLHMPMPILAVQILWLNLITDPLIGTSLALEKKESNLLEAKFEKLPKYFISPSMFVQMVLTGLTMGVITLFLFSQYYAVDYAKSVTVALTVLAVSQWYNGFNCQSSHKTFFSKRIFNNGYLWLGVFFNLILQLFAVYHPTMNRILKTTPLNWTDWMLVFSFSFLVIIGEEVRKLIVNYRRSAVK